MYSSMLRSYYTITTKKFIIEKMTLVSRALLNIQTGPKDSIMKGH